MKSTNYEAPYIHEDGCLLGCCAVSSGRSLRTFRRCLLPPSSGLNNPEDSHLHARRCENMKSHSLCNFLLPSVISSFLGKPINRS
jgi:hypothetical protein